MPLHIETPLVCSWPLSLVSGHSTWLKLEALQPPGSFKIRGIGAACEAQVRRGARRLISSSGGNAGMAVAYAGRRLSVPVLVVVPETATETAKERLRLEQAQVIVHGPSWHEANALALSMLEGSDAYIHPFDDPLLWAGHASMIDEVALAGLKPEAVVLSVGGGGLLAGVVQGLQRNGLNRVPVLAVETEGADSLHQSLAAGRLVDLERITSVASTLGAKRVCDRAFECAQEHPIRSIVVSDRLALSACERFLDDHRLLVEPACGASLALAYDRSSELAGFETVLFIVCGGATATIDQIRQWSAKYSS
ncbi:MAG: pyridoxal-phosphate dependent enzyme [Acidimicrobiia bacterium]|nr:pyridoxal-phosphate dependent enzyme [Acidimicrobiia bacterium]